MARSVILFSLVSSLYFVAACGDYSTSKLTDPSRAQADGALSGLGSASLTGSVQGHSFVPASAVFATVAYGSTATSLAITLSSEATFCLDQNQHKQRQNQTSLSLVLISLNAFGKTISPQEGNYPISLSQAIVLPSRRGASLFHALNEQCLSDLSTSRIGATVGSISLASVNDNEVKGSFDLQVGGNQLTGSFDAVPCAALAAQMQMPQLLSCEAH